MSSPNSMNLKQRVMRAGGWGIAGLVLSQLIRLGSNLLMTRLLVPEMFGIMAIVSMVQVIIWVLSDIGLNLNIVQSRRGDDPMFLDTAWVVQIIRGGILWLITLLLSIALHLANLGGLFPAHSVYASPELPLIIAVCSFGVIIQSFQSTKMATAHRDFDQKRLTQIEVISQCVGLIVMIVIGVVSRSIWSLVMGGFVAVIMTTVLSHTWMSGHSNRFRFEKQAFRELIGFGKWIFFTSAVGVLVSNGDRLLLGGVLDAHALGLYSIAALLVGAIHAAVVRLFARVVLPALSEVARNNPQRLREIYYRLRIPSDLLLLFLTGLLFAAGQLVIDLLYDPRYATAGGMLQILALSLFVVRYSVAHQIYLALGMPHYVTVISVVRFISFYTLVPLLNSIAGAQAAIWGIALYGLVTVPFDYYFTVKLRLNDFRRELIVLVALPAGYLCGFAVNLLR